MERGRKRRAVLRGTRLSRGGDTNTAPFRSAFAPERYYGPWIPAATCRSLSSGNVVRHTLLIGCFLLLFAKLVALPVAACGVGESASIVVSQQPAGGIGGLPFASQPIVVLTGTGGLICTNDSSTVIHATLRENPAVFASLARTSTCSDNIHNDNKTACIAIPGNFWLDASNSTTQTMKVLNGVAKFAGLYINENATGYSIQFVASGSGLYTTSQKFAVEIGPPHSIRLHRERSSGTLWAYLPSQDNLEKDSTHAFTVNAFGGAAFNPPPRLSLMDAGGNVVTDPAYSVGLGAEVHLIKWPSTQKNPTTGEPVNGSRIGSLTSNVSTLSMKSAFVSGTATFLGLQIDVAGLGYELRFTVFNLTSAFPDFESQAFVEAFCSQALLTPLGEEACIANNTWYPELVASCVDVNGVIIGDGHLVASTCMAAGGRFTPRQNASCTQPLLTHLGEGNCTAKNIWHPEISQIISGQSQVTGSAGVLISQVNLTVEVDVDVGVGLPNHTRVETFPYGSIKGGEAIYPAVRVFLEDAGGNLVMADSVSRCTVSLLSSPFNGHEEHPGYGVAQLGTERVPFVLPHPHAYLNQTAGDQSLTVDFHNGVATFFGLNISHLGG